MATSRLQGVLRNLRRAALSADNGPMTDGQLLDSFLTDREEAAFEGLVRRHGPMVLGVCRRVLGNEADAEDAFQATFLVLVRKAASIRPRDMVGNWLYGVAYRTALKTRSLSAKRKAREQQVIEMPNRPTCHEQIPSDWQAILDEELQRLPDKLRIALVLCDLEGRTRKEVARQLRIPEGTLSSRLARARIRLARQLSQRGIMLSGGALAEFLSEASASAALPASLLTSTVHAAIQVAAGHGTTSVVSAKVSAIAEGVIKTMILNKLNYSAAILIVVCLLGIGSANFLFPAIAQEPAAPIKKPAATPPDQKKPEAQSDHELIQGYWQPVKVMINPVNNDDGRILPKDEIEKLRLIFGEDESVMSFPDKGPKKMKYQLFPAKKPKRIEFDDGLTAGIYELKGETLQMFITEGGNRGGPAKLISQPDASHLFMIFKRVPMKGKNAQPLPDLKKVEPQKTPALPRAIKLQLDQPIDLKVKSPAVKVNMKPFHIIGIGKATFHLSDDHRLTATLKAGVAQYAKVDYWIYAAVFDEQGRLLGTASHKEPVEYIRLGRTPTISREIKLDFGVSKAFERAAFVMVAISEADVPEPGARIQSR